MGFNMRKAGWVTLAVGILMLVAGIVFALFIGGKAALLLPVSILVNSAAITMLRHRG